ncbi:YggT family protein [Salana multivorans]|uniref:YggT family protein n=1 Tax=Salana multivorans TaxID=120377 RepID=A0A3N2D230_9MICO|nr:YggT family protein [Salana multivorans]ROR93836.1 YggT family protein [Salana multivorans]
MSYVATVAYVVVLLFFVSLLVRVVFDVVQMAARSWRPRGIALVAAEAVYTVTDPPLLALRRRIPPLRVGPMAFDVAFLIVMLVTWVLLMVLGANAA